MKTFNIVLIMLLIFISFTGCTSADIKLEEANQSSISEEETRTSQTPDVTVDFEGPETEQNQEQGDVITVDCMEFYFDMQMSKAIEVLENCEIKYEISDDMSTIRSWAGTCINSKGLSLYFDIEEKLHEIRISGEQKTNLPVKIGDLVSDITNDLGEEEQFYSPEYPPGAVATLSSEYDLNGYFLRTVFAGERIPSENYAVWEIFVSKYSMEQYQDTKNNAKLLLVNKNGDKAELYIGMSRKDAVEVLEQRGIPNEPSENVSNLISGEMLLGQSTTSENDTFEGYSFSIYFDWNDRISTVYATGSGVYTSKGLTSGDFYSVGDDKEKMIELYGEDFYERPLGSEDYHIYRYKEAEQYLYICESIYPEENEQVTGIYISRYTGARALK